MISLGIDVGSNSVGSAWVDDEAEIVRLAVGVFPAGVDETDTKRGTPLNQDRRQKRILRRNLARRSKRKRVLRNLFLSMGLLPTDPDQLKTLLDCSDPCPWGLRSAGMARALTPFEFGRVLTHLNQRRGAVGIELRQRDEEEKEANGEPDEEGLVKEAIGRTQTMLKGRTFGQAIAELMQIERTELPGKPGAFVNRPVRNRRESFRFHADRTMIRDEFQRLWDHQKTYGGALSSILIDELKLKLDNPKGDDLWRHKGLLFGQRRTYWDSGTIGRCDLEPTDLRCPLADMYAQEFRVLQTVNNIRIQKRGEPERALIPDEREKVTELLRSQKSATPAAVRKALKFHGKEIRDFVSINLENDKEQEINTDWFHRAIVRGVFTEERWKGMTTSEHESVNRAILKFDPEIEGSESALRSGAQKWWALSLEQAEGLIEAWKRRPPIDKRVKLSRRALVNLLPWIREPYCLDVSTARKQFAEDATNGATPKQREGYALDRVSMSKADRHFLAKHPDLLPPAPTLANPVVRKAIHEVRRHMMGYLREFKRKPDRIVIELARSGTQSEKVRNRILADNRKREKERKEIVAEYKLDASDKSPTQRRKALERILLCRHQRHVCAYSGETISENAASEGTGLEIDHIVPESRSQDSGLNNKVLVFLDKNREKSNKTPKEFFSTEQFAIICQRLGHWQKAFPQKWRNLNRDAPDREAWLNSQLSDTAYAAKEVAAYLKSALYSDKKDGKQRIFFTKGQYTSILRRDWELQEKEGPKSRDDHRHHAVDAVVIAMSGPERLGLLARRSEAYEMASRNARPNYQPIDSPWGSVDDFRHLVMGEKHRLVVSHRAVKRKVTGFLHKADVWGAVDEAGGVFRIRCPIAQLSPKMLRMPVEEADAEVKARLFEEFKSRKYSVQDARRKAKEAVERGHFERKRIEPSLGKGGLVRDWELRRIMRECLQSAGLNPDEFSKGQIEEFAAAHKMKMPSGVPIHSVITIAPINDPIKIPVRDSLTGKQAVKPVSGEPVFRYHISRNNHHLEILEHEVTGKWSDEIVTTYQAAERRAKQLRLLRAAEKPIRDLKLPHKEQREKLKGIKAIRSRIIAENPIVSRVPRDGKRFVMSLSEGETLHMLHPVTRQDGYFVVFKISPGRAFFIHHWDARASVLRKDPAGNVIPDSQREEIGIAPSSLRDLGVEPGKPPQKVRIGVMGDVMRLVHD